VVNEILAEFTQRDVQETVPEVVRESMQEILQEIFPAVLENIITGYVTVFKRPFKSSRCLACDKPATYFQFCHEHHTLCLFCCDNTSQAIDNDDDEDNFNPYVICDECEKRYRPDSWMPYIEKAYDYSYDENMYEIFYRDDDYPIDIEYLKQGLLLLGMARGEGKKLNRLAKESFEYYGMEKLKLTILNYHDRFEDTEIYSRWIESQRKIGSYSWSAVLNMIRKL